MRRQYLLIVGVVTAIAVIIAGSLPRAPEVRAGQVMQAIPRLDGYRIYFTTGSGEASRFDRSPDGVSRLAGLLRLLGADLQTLEWHKNFPADADLLVIAGPRQDLTSEQLARLWLYIEDGGHVLLLADPAVDRTRAFDWRRGLFRLMIDEIGLRGLDDVVVTEGTEGLVTDFVAQHIDARHPITAALDEEQLELAFFGARSLESAEPVRDSITISPLVYSDGDFYGERAFAQYLRTGEAEYTAVGDIQRSRLLLAAAVEDTDSGTRIVLIGDREFVTNGSGFETAPPYSPSFVYPDNVRLVLNAVVWLLGVEAEPTVELAFPTPGPTSTPTQVPTPTPSPVPPTATPGGEAS